jgi:uncharacterized protein YecT (DUF1311 family)
MITGHDLRNIIAVMRNIDRDQIEAEAGRITDKAWSDFRDNPCHGYLQFGGHLQDSVARIVSSRLLGKIAA